MDHIRLRAFLLSSLMLAALAAFTSQPIGAQSSSSEGAFDAARGAFETMAEAERKAVQDALIWTGDYSGVANGAFGRQTYAAIAAYQTRLRQPSNGILTPQVRSSLFDAAQQVRNAAGFAVVDDSKTGIRIGVPTKTLPKQSTNPSGGSRWQSADDKVTLDTRVAPPDTTLQALYDRTIAIQTPGRVVSYRVLRPDFFVVAGETAGGKFYTRYSSGPEGLRGFSIGYDKAIAPQIDRLVVAIANSFTPFPTAVAVSQAPTSPSQPELKRPTQSVIGTGIAVGSHQVLTTAPVASCKEVLVSGLKPRQIAGRGPFVLDFAEDVKAKPLKAARQALVEGASLLVVGFNDEGGKPSLVALPAQALFNGLISAPLQPGTSGAPILDRRGALVGLVNAVPSEHRKIAGVVPASSYPIVPVSDLTVIAPSLSDQPDEAEAQPRNTADIVNSVRPALLPILCGS